MFSNLLALQTRYLMYIMILKETKFLTNKFIITLFKIIQLFIIIKYRTIKTIFILSTTDEIDHKLLLDFSMFILFIKGNDDCMTLYDKDNKIEITTVYITDKKLKLHIIYEKEFDIEFDITNDWIDVQYIRSKFPYWKESFTIKDKFIKNLDDKESVNRSKKRNFEMFENIQRTIIIILKRSLKNMMIVKK